MKKKGYGGVPYSLWNPQNRGYGGYAIPQNPGQKKGYREVPYPPNFLNRRRKFGAHVLGRGAFCRLGSRLIAGGVRQRRSYPPPPSAPQP